VIVSSESAIWVARTDDRTASTTAENFDARAANLSSPPEPKNGKHSMGPQRYLLKSEILDTL
jgi:hypothetical protein